MPENKASLGTMAIKTGAVFLRWCIFAFILSVTAAFICHVGNVSSAYLGYISSFISFASAFIACFASGRISFGEGLVISAALTLLLILCGLIAGGGLDGGAVISLSSFTVCGCLCAALVRKSYKKNTKGKKLKPSKRTS